MNVICYFDENVVICIESVYDDNVVEIWVVNLGSYFVDVDKFFWCFWWGDNVCYIVGFGLGLLLVNVIVLLYGGLVFYCYVDEYNIFLVCLFDSGDS